MDAAATGPGPTESSALWIRKVQNRKGSPHLDNKVPFVLYYIPAFLNRGPRAEAFTGGLCLSIDSNIHGGGPWVLKTSVGATDHERLRTTAVYNGT